MVTYEQAAKMVKGLIHLGWNGPIGISAKRGNGSNADNIKADFDRDDDNMQAEAFMPSEAYDDYTLHIPSGGGGTDVAARNRVQASVKQLAARFASRSDGLNDLTSTDAEYPLPQQPWISTVLNWPEVRTGWQARLDKARSIMGV